ncbi:MULTISPECIES: molybdopterin-dependent oxidoreductase [unclassified Sphingopyxis]|uniref:molybdopterin-dependent oxidoreductase n=1 Tax=unclassified Sphingopyxis TaxID=2614943 RepID=UPI000736FFB5|nr:MULTISPECIES: molybdopterin-dependent oxidoreductase [unclassified Sphingopyxis]KTE38797.1 molybdopterin-binding protein [Sphingopyxis sp. HIX]KTE83253.1 molybdopterin-binding protein [Sphingopyxis sp. HXXIV]
MSGGIIVPRRRLIAGAGGLVAAMPLLSACDAINEAPLTRKILSMGEEMHMASQRALMDRDALAREFTRADLSPVFRSNGTKLPPGAAYAAHAARGFADWRVAVTGLVTKPLSLSMADIRAMPQRTQITRHDCVEGWSAIGEWTGVQLSRVLAAAGLKDRARYIVFRCADRIGDALYYESCDLVDALHPQTILAWALNRELLPIANGAPLRLRIERQLGYKHAKYLTGIEAVESLDHIGAGKGGFWEDRVDYEWYAGI